MTGAAVIVDTVSYKNSQNNDIKEAASTFPHIKTNWGLTEINRANYSAINEI